MNLSCQPTPLMSIPATSMLCRYNFQRGSSSGGHCKNTKCAFWHPQTADDNLVCPTEKVFGACFSRCPFFHPLTVKPVVRKRKTLLPTPNLNPKSLGKGNNFTIKKEKRKRCSTSKTSVSSVPKKKKSFVFFPTSQYQVKCESNPTGELHATDSLNISKDDIVTFIENCNQHQDCTFAKFSTAFESGFLPLDILCHDKVPIDCVFCDCKFQTETGYLNHVSLFHFNKELSSYLSKTETCPLCNEKIEKLEVRILHFGSFPHNQVKDLLLRRPSNIGNKRSVQDENLVDKERIKELEKKLEESSVTFETQKESQIKLHEEALRNLEQRIQNENMTAQCERNSLQEIISNLEKKIETDETLNEEKTKQLEKSIHSKIMEEKNSQVQEVKEMKADHEDQIKNLKRRISDIHKSYEKTIDKNREAYEAKVKISVLEKKEEYENKLQQLEKVHAKNLIVVKEQNDKNLHEVVEAQKADQDTKIFLNEKFKEVEDKRVEMVKEKINFLESIKSVLDCKSYDFQEITRSIKALVTSKEATVKEVFTLKSKSQDLQTEVNNLSVSYHKELAKNKDLLQEIEHLKSDLADQENISKSFKEENVKLLKETQILAFEQKQNLDLTLEVKQLKQDVQNKATELHTKGALIEKIRKDNLDKNQEIIDCKKMKDQHKEMSEKVTNLLKLLKEKTSSLEDLKHSNELLKGQINEVTTSKETLKKKNLALSEELKNLERNIETYDELQKQLDAKSSNSKEESVVAEIANLKEDLVVMEKENDSFVELVGHLSKTVQERDMELAASKEAYEEMEKERDEFDKKCCDLKEELEKVSAGKKAQLAQHQVAMKGLNCQNQKLKIDLTTIQNDLKKKESNFQHELQQNEQLITASRKETECMTRKYLDLINKILLDKEK